MPNITSQQLFDALQTGWGEYVGKFNGLSPAEQSAFLEREGYPRFHDLLAHIIAWWEEALEIITAVLESHDLPSREYDIDAFNAEALAEYRDWTESDLLAHYENLREALLDLVAELPDGALENKRIAGWLHACVIEHYEQHLLGNEHRLP